MGNDCCSKRLKISELPKKKKKKNKREAKSAILRDCDSPSKPFITSIRSINQSLNIPGEDRPISLGSQVSESEVSENEFEYSLNSLGEVSSVQRARIISLLNFYQTEAGYEEIDSFFEASLHLNQDYSIDLTIILTTKSLYFVNTSNFLRCERRVALERLFMICIDKSITSGIFHSTDLQDRGDVWVTSYKLEDCIFAIQNFVYKITEHYLPSYSVEKSELPYKFNSLSYKLVKVYENDIMLKINDTLVGEGIIGDNIEYVHKSLILKKGRKAECYLVLSRESFYIVSGAFELCFDTKTKKIYSLGYSENDKLLLISSVSSDVVIEAPNRFLETFQRICNQYIDHKVPVKQFRSDELQILINGK